MKRKILILLAIIATNSLLAQYIMVEDKGGDIQYQKLANTEKITFGSPPSFSSCGDIVLFSGEYYGTIQIGTQCWLKENLNVGDFINSSSGGSNNDGEQTNNGTIEKYCYNNLESNCDIYGGFYQWNEAMQYGSSDSGPVGSTQGICPSGWHLPTYTELETLRDAASSSGNALKDVGQGSEQGGDGVGTNTSGFSALLTGGRSDNGSFSGLGGLSYFWSSTESSGANSHFIVLDDNNNILFLNVPKAYGLSIRCIKN